MRGVIHWVRMFQEILPNTITGLVFVLENNGCDEPYTYRIDGEHAYPIGHGDLHDRAYDKFEKTASFASIDRIADGTREGMKLQFSQCPYQIRVYPSSDMESAMTSKTPVVVTCSVAIVFLFVIFMFFGYDRLVEIRQRVLLAKAKRTHRIGKFLQACRNLPKCFQPHAPTAFSQLPRSSRRISEIRFSMMKESYELVVCWVPRII